jgi:hypothetical protein
MTSPKKGEFSLLTRINEANTSRGSSRQGLIPRQRSALANLSFGPIAKLTFAMAGLIRIECYKRSSKLRAVMLPQGFLSAVSFVEWTGRLKDNPASTISLSLNRE